MAELSTKPYLIRAIHQWCEDSGYRPYIAVMVDERTQVPREFVRNGEIVLNVSAVATNRLVIGNDLIEFEARFSGTVRQVSIPIENVSAIYAQETGHGMAFDVPKPLAIAPERAPSESAVKASGAGAAAPKTSQRPKLVPRAGSNDSPPSVVPPAGAMMPTDSSEPPVASSPPALQAVESSAPERPVRPAASKSRRRAKLAAVPDSKTRDPAEALHSEPTPPTAPSAEASEGAPPQAPDAAAPAEPAPEEPPPSPPNRPQLKRIK